VKIDVRSSVRSHAFNQIRDESRELHFPTHETLENLENWRFLSETNYYRILSTKFQSRLVVDRETDSFVGNTRENWSIDGQNPCILYG
jgi:hypothetical protein